MGGTHGLMLPFLLTANVHLVTFHSTFECLGIILRVKQTYLLKHVPRGSLGYMNVTAQLVAADTLFVGRYKVHCNEPLDKRQLCILKDGSDKTGKILSTVLAAESSIFTGGTMVFTAVWAYNVAVSPT